MASLPGTWVKIQPPDDPPKRIGKRGKAFRPGSLRGALPSDFPATPCYGKALAIRNAIRNAEVLYLNDDGVLFARFTGTDTNGTMVFWWELFWPDGHRLTRHTTKKPSPVAPFKWAEGHLGSTGD